MPKQPCPLCGSPAGYDPDDFGRRKQFDCPKCRYFIISPGTESKVAALPMEDKAKLAASSSKCPAHRVLHIYTDENGAIRGDYVSV